MLGLFFTGRDLLVGRRFNALLEERVETYMVPIALNLVIFIWIVAQLPLIELLDFIVIIFIADVFLFLVLIILLALTLLLSLHVILVIFLFIPLQKFLYAGVNFSHLCFSQRLLVICLFILSAVNLVLLLIILCNSILDRHDHLIFPMTAAEILDGLFSILFWSFSQISPLWLAIELFAVRWFL